MTARWSRSTPATSNATHYDPDTGAVLHTGTGRVQKMSWHGARSLVTQAQSDVQLVDWRRDAVLWSQAVNPIRRWNHELSDDLAFDFSPPTSTASPATTPAPPSPGWSTADDEVVILRPDGPATTLRPS